MKIKTIPAWGLIPAHIAEEGNWKIINKKKENKMKYLAYFIIALGLCIMALSAVSLIAVKFGEESAIRKNHTINIYCSEPEFLKQLNEINLFNDEKPYCIHIQQTTKIQNEEGEHP